MNDEPNLKQGFRGVDLVTLSACNTATSQIPQDGKEVDGLATTLHKNGAQAVIATLWKADDAATRELMVDFYRHWTGAPGTTKVQALQQAQLDLLYGTTSTKTASTNLPGTSGTASHADTSPPPPSSAAPKPNHSHPYYWAPFILMGNWN